MMETAMCRICLAKNIRMHSIENTDLQHIYEKLTSYLLVAEARPKLACYICYVRLKHTYQLMRKCFESELLLTQMTFGSQYDPNAIEEKLSNFKSLFTTPIIFSNINNNVDALEPKNCDGQKFVIKEAYGAENCNYDLEKVEIIKDGVNNGVEHCEDETFTKIEENEDFSQWPHLIPNKIIDTLSKNVNDVNIKIIEEISLISDDECVNEKNDFNKTPVTNNSGANNKMPDIIVQIPDYLSISTPEHKNEHDDSIDCDIDETLILHFEKCETTAKNISNTKSETDLPFHVNKTDEINENCVNVNDVIYERQSYQMSYELEDEEELNVDVESLDFPAPAYSDYICQAPILPDTDKQNSTESTTTLRRSSRKRRAPRARELSESDQRTQQKKPSCLNRSQSFDSIHRSGRSSSVKIKRANRNLRSLDSSYQPRILGSSFEIDPTRRSELERIRRNRLKVLLCDLKNVIPDLMNEQYVPKIVIINKAAALCRELCREDMLRQQLERDQKILLEKLKNTIKMTEDNMDEIKREVD